MKSSLASSSPDSPLWCSACWTRPLKAMLERFDDAEREFQTPPDALGQPVAVN